MGLWEEAGPKPNPNPNPKPQTPPPCPRGPTGPSFGMGVQLGPRIRYSNFRAVGLSYLKNYFPPHSEQLGLAGNTFERFCPNKSPFGKTFFLLGLELQIYVVLGTPGNVCKHFGISSYLEKAGKGV